MTHEPTRTLITPCDKLEVGALYAVDGGGIEPGMFMVVAEQPCRNVDHVRVYYRVLWNCGALLTWYVDPIKSRFSTGLNVYKLLSVPSL